ELTAHPRSGTWPASGVPDPLMGERLAVCVVARGAHAPTPSPPSANTSRGAAWSGANTPERLLVVPELPLTAAGKPDRAALRKRLTESSALV
ncbi:long-chain fatty acid--CoA ligase, partial [Streptomyces sp. CH8.1]